MLCWFSMKYGVDIAVRRADDLDKLMLEEVVAYTARGETPTVLDIGCGAGGQAKRLASFGAKVTAVDVSDYSAEFTVISKELRSEGAGTVTFVKADFISWLNNTSSSEFDIVCCQRTLHYLRYIEARHLLKELRKRTKGNLYLSVTGATSAIAESYPALSMSIAKRFAKLSSKAQEVFSITAPLCVYHEEEVSAILKDTDWNIIQFRVSDFGNIKVVATLR